MYINSAHNGLKVFKNNDVCTCSLFDLLATLVFLCWINPFVPNAPFPYPLKTPGTNGLKGNKVSSRESLSEMNLKNILRKLRSNLQEVPESCARVSFLIKLQMTPTTLLKKKIWHRSFSVSFRKFLRTPFLIDHLWWLLLKIHYLLIQ